MIQTQSKRIDKTRKERKLLQTTIFKIGEVGNKEIKERSRDKR